jgi:hypothetical protein
LERKFPDLGNVSSPDAFVAFVRGKGLQVTANSMQLPSGKMQEVSVPEKDLALLFVTEEVCPTEQNQ